MAIDYSKLTDEQLSIIEDYCKNDMKKLKKVCYPIWGNKGLPSCYHDDLYDDAMKVLVESVISYNSQNRATFKTFLANNITLSQREWYRNNFQRAKRNNLELDKDGRIKARKDENGKEVPIIIKNISFDAPVFEGDADLKEIVKSNFILEEEMNSGDIFRDVDMHFSKEMSMYLNRLSKLDKKVLYLISIGFKSGEIINKLHITKKQYDNCLAAIHSYRNISVLLQKRRR